MRHLSPLLLGGVSFSLLLSLLTGPLLAQPAPRVLALDLTTPSATPRTQVIEAFLAEQSPLKPGTYQLLSGSSPEFTQSYHWLYPTGESGQCPAPFQRLEEQLDQAQRLIVDLELDAALTVLRASRRSLPCQTRALTRGQLRRLFYLEGIAHFYNENRLEADRSWLQALAIEPSIVPLEGFAMEINDAFLESARELPRIQPISLEVAPELHEREILIDGQALTADASLSLRPGMHLAQALNPAGLARTSVFELYPDGPSSLKPMLALDPPDSLNYVRETLRTYVLADKLEPAQIQALTAYAREHRHPYILFVIASTQAQGGMELLVFEPGAGMRRELPAGLATYAVAPEAPAPVAPATEPPPPSPARPVPPATSSSAQRLRLKIGAAGFGDRGFLHNELGYAQPVSNRLAIRASILYGNDLGTSTGAAPHLLGLGVGLEAAFPLARGVVSPGIGLQTHLAAVLPAESGTRAILALSPNAQVEVRLPLGPHLSAGLEVGGGILPGLIGALGTLPVWQAGLVVGYQL